MIYNPKSSHPKRNWQFNKALEILKQLLPEDQPAGVVRKTGREDAEKTLTTLGQLSENLVDEYTTLIIGNSSTKKTGNNLYTHRGYQGRYSDREYGKYL